MSGCSQGAQANLLVDSVVPWDASSERYMFLYETMQKKGRIVGGRGIVGSRSQPIERTRLGSYTVGGIIAMEMNPGDLDAWLPRILGATEATDVFALAETVPVFETFINKVGASLEYTSCYINRAIFTSRAGPGDQDEEVVRMVLEIVCKDEDPNDSWPGSIAVLSTATNRAPYLHSDSVLTINAAGYPVKNWAIIVDNHLRRRWVNSLTATAICPGDRTVQMISENPFSSTEFAGLYDLAAAKSGVVATMVLTNPNTTFSTTFTMDGLQWADESPTVRGKREIPLRLNLVARMKGTARELVVTNVSA